MTGAESGSTYRGKINYDALCFWIHGMLVFEAGWALWEMHVASRSWLSLLGVMLLTKTAVHFLTIVSLYRWRPQAWAITMTGTALFGIVVPFALVTSGIRMSASQSSIAGLFAYASFVAAAGVFAVLTSMAWVFWRSYRAFDVNTHHRWRLLVRVGLPSTLLLLAIDACRLHVDSVIR